MTLTKSAIINNHRLTFDPADKANGSLYLCDDPSVEPGTNVQLIIDRLRAANLWSTEAPKEVPDEHRAAYEAQLELVEVVTFRDADSPFLAARFNHEKFPSDDTRWQSWLDLLETHFRRQD